MVVDVNDADAHDFQSTLVLSCTTRPEVTYPRCLLAWAWGYRKDLKVLSSLLMTCAKFSIILEFIRSGMAMNNYSFSTDIRRRFGISQASLASALALHKRSFYLPTKRTIFRASECRTPNLFELCRAQPKISKKISRKGACK